MNYLHKLVFFSGVVIEVLIALSLSWFPMYDSSGRIISTSVSMLLFVALYFYMKVYIQASKVLTIIILAIITSVPLILVMIFLILYFGLQFASGASQQTVVSYLISALLVFVLATLFPLLLSFYYNKYNTSIT